MDKSCNSSGESTISTASSNGSRDHNQLTHLNRISHKISKPHHQPFLSHFPKHPDHRHRPPLRFPPPPPPPPPPQPQPQPPPQNQPPVYNINKNDFRDVVQRLTGSPAHERSPSSSSSAAFSAPPPPINPPKPQSSRLQRIRPPPLGQIGNRPPPRLLDNNPAPPRPLNELLPPTAAVGFNPGQRPSQPLSPLPPLPAVHAAAESPISAYMRFLKNSISGASPERFPPPPSRLPPQWNTNVGQQPLPNLPSNPLSPRPFGCFPSPRSARPLLFSPTGGQLGFQQLPLSPTLPVPSPSWKKAL